MEEIYHYRISEHTNVSDNAVIIMTDNGVLILTIQDMIQLQQQITKLEDNKRLDRQILLKEREKKYDLEQQNERYKEVIEEVLKMKSELPLLAITILQKALEE